MAIVLIYLIVMTFVADPHQAYIKEESNNQATHHISCSSSITEFELVMYCLEAACIIYGAELSYATKDVPGALNESKSIARCITLIGMMSMLVFPLVFLFDIEVTLKQTIAMISLALGTIGTCAVIFGPRALSIYEGDEVDENMQIKKTSQSNSKGSAYHDDVPVAGGVTAKYGDVSASELMFHKQMDGRKLPTEERYKICREQLDAWNKLLATLDQESDLRSSQNSSLASGAEPAGPTVVAVKPTEPAFQV
jgi:hypothetical protein